MKWFPKNSWPVRLCVLFFLLPLIVLILTYSRLPPVVPLFYSLPWGKEQLAPLNFLFFLFAIELLIFLINYLISLIFLKKFPEAKQILTFFSVGISFLLGFTIIRIIILII